MVPSVHLGLIHHSLGLNYEKRSELRRVDPDAMQTLIAAFEAASWDEAKAVFDEHYSE
jgi:hypothetical protein